MTQATLKPSRYLFLQGQIGRFFSVLGLALAHRGHAVHRIHFNGGDARFWALPGGVAFDGDEDGWQDFLSQRLHAWGITDLVLFGDCRPLHQAAIRMARVLGIAVHVFEEGYLRPDFITLESGGVNGHSSLPRETSDYLEAATALPAWSTPAPVPASFARRAGEDVLYNLATAAGSWRFPHYRSHKPWHPFTEYAVGLRRFPVKLLTRGRTERRARAVEQGALPYFLFPLQVDTDSQIRFHAPAGGMAGAIAQVLRSFAAHAPADALLAITEHPLDYGPVDTLSTVRRLAADAGVLPRVVFLRGGSPAALVKAARGLVTVNSTIGITALAGGVPVFALGAAIYGLSGLIHPGRIEGFWQAPQPPDPMVFDAFRRVVAHRTQIHGGFYSAQAIARAVAGALVRLQATRGESRLEPVAPAEPLPSQWRSRAAADDPISA